MKELKFRAWDKAEAMMVKPFELGSPSSLFHSGNKYIIMQYTGFEDKNGKGIYEGDILKNSDDNTVYIVDDMGQLCYDWNINKFVCRKYEIVGNVYENPELLRILNY